LTICILYGIYLLVPLHQSFIMKLRKHESGLAGDFMSPFVIITVSNKDCLQSILQVLKDGYTNYKEYCLLTGDYSLLEPIVKNLQDRYHAEWIGDHYCILSHRSTYRHPIPRAKIVKKEFNNFLLSLRGTKILIINHIKRFSSLQKSIIGDVHMVVICDSNYDPEDDPAYLEGWTYHPNYPNFHTYKNNTLIHLDIWDFSQRLKGANVCNIYIPYWQAEYLYSCLKAV